MKPISDLKHLQHGDHLCLLYRSVEEQKNILSPFIKEGLSRGEFCLYITDDHMDPELANLLASDGIDLLRLRQEGSVQLLSRYQTFLRYARFEPSLMIEFFERLLDQTLAKQFSGARVIIDMSWALTIGCDQLITFEALLNDHMMPWKMTTLCQYHLDRFASRILQDVLRTHPLAVLGEHVCPNFYCEPTNLILSDPPADARIEWMMNTLKKAAPMIGKNCKR
jgi:hypothetical protein